MFFYEGKLVCRLLSAIRIIHPEIHSSCSDESLSHRQGRGLLLFGTKDIFALEWELKKNPLNTLTTAFIPGAVSTGPIHFLRFST